MGYYITVEHNVNIYIEDYGPEDGQPILFIHGWPLNHRVFEYQYDQLPKAGYRCIGVDLRGFGKSDNPWTGYSYDRLADDIRSVIDTLKLEHVTLTGHSMGGAIAIRYMARHAGHKIFKLALIAAAAPIFTQRQGYPYGLTTITKERVNELIKATYTDRPEMLHNFGKMFFYQNITESFKEWFQGLGLTASGNATAKTAVSLRDEELWQDMSKIHVPTGIFHGVHDEICPFTLAEALQAGIKGSELVPFMYSGHGLFYCEMEKFNHELAGFIG
ncbi:alpha/beta fold hydrolase [Halobacillus amylolyticus]|uniref:Alpha/beta hydrolase n=1 Tax=Halobacillus amylolyticus TaxID=2932259 RepID=A0ABY4H7M1_9BACI|nr:alpha/beta hydrolase [Halobacillus amylolyticus]UOR10868.1 alpha/beta hydrolase [Halobacillus amylolyticus]